MGTRWKIVISPFVVNIATMDSVLMREAAVCVSVMCMLRTTGWTHPWQTLGVVRAPRNPTRAPAMPS